MVAKNDLMGCLMLNLVVLRSLRVIEEKKKEIHTTHTE